MKAFLQTSLRYHSKNVTPRKHWARLLVTRTMANWAASLRDRSCNLQRDLADQIAPRCTPICKHAHNTRSSSSSGLAPSPCFFHRGPGEPQVCSMPAFQPRFPVASPAARSWDTSSALAPTPHCSMPACSISQAPRCPGTPCSSPPPESGPLLVATPSLRVPPAERAAATPGPWGILAFPTAVGVARGRERETDSKEKQRMKSKLAVHKFSDDFYKDATV